MPTDLHPVPALRMSGTVCLLPLYAFFGVYGDNFTFMCNNK